MAPVLGGQRLQPIRVIIASKSTIDAVVALADTGKYVSVDVRNIDTEVAENSEDGGDENNLGGVALYQSVYETALRNRIPRPVIEDLIRIYSYDVDFQRKVQPGNSFDALRRRRRDRGCRQPQRRVVRRVDRRRRNEEILPLPVAG